MTYRWTSPDRLELRPHRSLPRRGFAVVILLFFTLVTIPLTAMVGTVALWGLLPFAMAALAALWWGLERSYRDADILEVLTLAAPEIVLTRTNPDKTVQEWSCNSHWIRITKHERGGPVPHYVTLNGNGREVEIGAFLSEDERKALYGELASRLSDLR
ncbi:hypothetical protein OB2597_06920 [Pseudooceanicola batsensis HTCC2597]|uniref:Integral membrane protein n=1 Tax=Pseudooceanicola batsensis (strain ATCC BAA-863 / DSM 15984 / KCTC 12145 / HTCC2597) TaxID=252305 RepID=A3TTL9_PSEBH|nr:DUF2244 domain-containing protein [Pseudooceanicola batsensis]EAQ04996.1 hypothetical protein OB2597_06920 [Pseudooceanicola batsensis HTCC2597]